MGFIAVMGAAGAGVWLAMQFLGTRLSGWTIGLTGVMIGGLTLALGPPTGAALGWTSALLVPLTALALVDAATRRLPDVLTIAVLALGLLRLVIDGQPWTTAATVALLLVALGLLVDRFWPDGPVGAGDFLLVGAATVWLGVAPLLELGLLTALLVWAHYLALWLTGRAAGGVPLAPALSLALLALWLAAPG